MTPLEENPKRCGASSIWLLLVLIFVVGCLLGLVAGFLITVVSMYAGANAVPPIVYHLA